MDKELAKRRQAQERGIVHMDLQELARKLTVAIDKTDMTAEELREVHSELLDIYLRFQ